jgi:hypothetical protein
MIVNYKRNYETKTFNLLVSPTFICSEGIMFLNMKWPLWLLDTQEFSVR